MTETHFEAYIKGKHLEVTSNHRLFVRAKDKAGEEWTIYNDQLVITEFEMK